MSSENGLVWMRLGAKVGLWALAFALSVAVLAPLARRAVPETMSPDFICYWGAGKAIANGQSPYDVSLQAQYQKESGWDKAKNGLGIYDFMPYYYPPWFGMLFVPILPLGFATAKAAWAVINVELLLMSGYLLRHATPVKPRYMPLILVPLFAFSVVSVILGQTLPLALFLIVASWRLVENEWDLAAGAVLAWLSVKPQLTAVLVLAVLVWTLVRGRWRVLTGFCGVLLALVLISQLLVPGWLGEMLQATRKTPQPTDYFPWIGTTWFLLLRTVGLKGVALAALYALLAVPALAVVFRAASSKSRALGDVVSLSLLAVFIVMPYGRHYDFPTLLIPFLVMVGSRLPEWVASLLLLVLLLLPYIHFGLLERLKSISQTPSRLFPECTFSWVPIVLIAFWVISSRLRSNGPQEEIPVNGEAETGVNG